MSTAAPDARWAELMDCGPFTTHSARLFMRTVDLDSDEAARFGFRVEPHHCNLRPTCHGGMLATFADIAMARGAQVIVGIGPSMPTITMTVDFMAPAPLGEWLEASVKVDRKTRTLVFVQAIMHVGEVPVLRSSGIFRHSP